MKKMVYIVIALVLLVGGWLLLETGGWQTYDYGLHCTRCLLDRHVVEKRLFGCTVSRTETARQRARDYERLFGHPCEHVFRKGGFGRGSGLLLRSSIACGSTAEGAVFRYRLAAAQAAYDAEHRLGDGELALRTFKLIDKLLPAEFVATDSKQLDPQFATVLYLLADKLSEAKSSEDWRQVLEEAQTGFTSALEDAANKP